jgi:sporulation protein YlmC with PRC-barrel domain
MSRVALLGVGFAVAHVAATQSKGGKEQHGSITGLSAKRQVLGQSVYNDNGELVGKIEDLILAKRVVSHAIVGVGGFLSIGAHNVAIPVGQFTRTSDKIVLPGATKQTILAMPRFEYGV